MTDNPLSGISIPSLADIAERVTSQMGTNTLDMGNPMQRKRLQDYIEQALGMAITFELERALHAATDKAINHVFMVMRDANYQEKRSRYRKASAKRRREEKIKQQEAEKRQRMADSLKALTSTGKRLQ